MAQRWLPFPLVSIGWLCLLFRNHMVLVLDSWTETHKETNSIHQLSDKDYLLFRRHFLQLKEKFFNLKLFSAKLFWKLKRIREEQRRGNGDME